MVTPSVVCGWSSLVLDSESQLSEHGDGAALPALEITGGQALAGGELISRAQDRFRRVTAFVPDQVISRGRAETMFSEERLRPEPVVVLYRAHHVIAGHVVPYHCHRVLPGSLWPAVRPCRSRGVARAPGGGPAHRIIGTVLSSREGIAFPFWRHRLSLRAHG